MSSSSSRSFDSKTKKYHNGATSNGGGLVGSKRPLPSSSSSSSGNKTAAPSEFGEPIAKRTPSTLFNNSRCDKCLRDHIAASLRREAFCADCNTKRFLCVECIKKGDFVCQPCQKDGSLRRDRPIKCETCDFECYRMYWISTDQLGEHRFCSLCSKNPDAGNCAIVRNLPPPPPPPTPPTSTATTNQPPPNFKITVLNPSFGEQQQQQQAEPPPPSPILLDKMQEMMNKIDSLTRLVERLTAWKEQERTEREKQLVGNGVLAPAQSSSGAQKFTVTDKKNGLLGDVDIETATDYDG